VARVRLDFILRREATERWCCPSWATVAGRITLAFVLTTTSSPWLSARPCRPWSGSDPAA